MNPRISAIGRPPRDDRPVVVVDLHLRIDPQQVINGRANVAGADRAVLNVGGVGIGRAYTVPPRCPRRRTARCSVTQWSRPALPFTCGVQASLIKTTRVSSNRPREERSSKSALYVRSSDGRAPRSQLKLSA